MCKFYLVNNMAVGDQAVQGARASASLVLNMFSWNEQIQKWIVFPSTHYPQIMDYLSKWLGLT